MAERTGIAWTDTTWNPVTGCTKVSEGCRNCYASAIADRFWGKRKFTDVRTHPDRLDAPLRWRKPRRVFVNSMSDLFHDAVPDEFIDLVFAAMAQAPRHTFQILTKRPERMRRWFDAGAHLRMTRCFRNFVAYTEPVGPWPLPNVWLGVSCEDQKTANDRIPLLLSTPAAIRFLSCEPLLGPINLELAQCSCPWPADAMRTRHLLQCPADTRRPEDQRRWALLHWVIVGGESGRGHRPMSLDWARELRQQCRAAGVPFFFKQNSGPRPGQGEDALGEVVQEFPGGDSGTATAGGRGG